MFDVAFCHDIQTMQAKYLLLRTIVVGICAATADQARCLNWRFQILIPMTASKAASSTIVFACVEIGLAIDSATF